MLVNMSVLNRIIQKRRAVSTALHIQTTDIVSALSNLDEIFDSRNCRESILATGYGLNNDGAICLAQYAVHFEFGIDDGEEEQDSQATDGGIPRLRPVNP